MNKTKKKSAGMAVQTRMMTGFIAAGILLAAALGVYFFDRVRSSEREREVINWQVRLGIVAASRAAAIETWLGDQGRAVQSLAENASLQIYLAELDLLMRAGSWKPGTAVPEAEYLQNLLAVSAEQAGFVPERLSTTVNANVQPAGHAGMALLDAKGVVLAATTHMPPIDERFKSRFAEARSGALALIDLHTTSAGNRIGFIAPIYAIQSGGVGSAVIGFVAAIRAPGRDFFDQLVQPGIRSDSGETYLVRRSGKMIEYISPLADGTRPMKRQLDAETVRLVDAAALEAPGKFIEGRDYAGDEVMAVGRAIPSAPWVVVRKVAVDDALGPFEQRFEAALWIVLLLVVIMSTAVFAVWRHGASVRAGRAMEKYREVAAELSDRNRFLKAVTDGHPAQISAVDENGVLTFANPAFASEYGLTPEDAKGKDLAIVMGASRGVNMRKLNDAALEENQQVHDTLSFTDSKDQKRTFQSFHIPLEHEGKDGKSVLMIQDDISEVVEARERRENVLRQLVGTLVALADQKDPFSAQHSKRVAEVSATIAGHMGLGSDTVRTCDLTGNLVNIGKFFVPDELLTKKGGLSDDEMQVIRDGLLAGADLLESVEFDVPVIKALRQLQERWDGGGHPDGLTGDGIEEAARIVAVANAFVGMVSARAYRDPMSFKEAIDRIFANAGESYDRKVVVALMDFIENHEGREAWKHYSEAG